MNSAWSVAIPTIAVFLGVIFNRQEFTAFRAEVKADLTQMRNEIAQIRGEVAQLRVEMIQLRDSIHRDMIGLISA